MGVHSCKVGYTVAVFSITWVCICKVVSQFSTMYRVKSVQLVSTGATAYHDMTTYIINKPAPTHRCRTWLVSMILQFFLYNAVSYNVCIPVLKCLSIHMHPWTIHTCTHELCIDAPMNYTYMYPWAIKMLKYQRDGPIKYIYSLTRGDTSFLKSVIIWHEYF